MISISGRGVIIILRLRACDNLLMIERYDEDVFVCYNDSDSVEDK